MKKILSAILVLCLTFSLCACGTKDATNTSDKGSENSNQSAAAKKADELILAIGEVTIEREAVILAAKAYYDTLSNSEKKQVKNYKLLEEAIALLAELKSEADYEEIYQAALLFEEKALIDEAFAEYKKLPTTYKDVSEKIEKLSPYAGLAGKWVCDSATVRNSNGAAWHVFINGITTEYTCSSNGGIGLNCRTSSTYIKTTTNIFSKENSTMHTLLTAAFREYGLTMNTKGNLSVSNPQPMTSPSLAADYAFTYSFSGDTMTLHCEQKDKRTNNTTTVDYIFTRTDYIISIN